MPSYLQIFAGSNSSLRMEVDLPLTVNAGADTSIPYGGSTNLNSTVTGGSHPYYYSWSPTTGLSDPYTANPVASPLSNTTYILTVTDGSGEIKTDDIGISVDVVPPSGYASSITQYGITWTFDGSYQVGQFVTGDWWVVGPLTVVSVNPAPTGSGTSARNGSSVNPVPSSYQCYDGRSSTYYNATGRASFPLSLSPSQSLVSTVSKAEGSNPDLPTRALIDDAAILTCVSTPQSAYAFRPAYCGNTKTIYNANDMNIGLLPSLASVIGVPTPITKFYDGTYTTAYGVTNFKKVWLDHVIDNGSQRHHPYNSMPYYGEYSSAYVGDALLMLCLGDVGDRTALARYICQYGIDLYGVAQSGGSWPNAGGNAPGRKAPIVFAGWMLGVSGMLNIGTSVRFGEQDQSFYVTQDEVDLVLYCEVDITITSTTSNSITGTLNSDLNGAAYVKYGQLHVKSGSGTGQVRLITATSQVWDVTLHTGDSITLTVDPIWDTIPDGVVEILGYQTADIGIADWGIRHHSSPVSDNPALGNQYRDQNGRCWVGFTLAARIMGLKSSWNYDAMFDYIDRWMNVITEDFPLDKVSHSWHETMWNTYRSLY